VTIRVALAAPDGEIWSGTARMVIAKTRDGDIGILTGHPPVLGLLADASLVRILDIEDGEGSGGSLLAAVSTGFLAVADDRVSVLAREAQVGPRIDTAAAQAVLTETEPPAAGEAESMEVRYSRALLQAAGERS
jgi:F-type H+-transporting ATPase subunit epsilon